MTNYNILEEFLRIQGFKSVSSLNSHVQIYTHENGMTVKVERYGNKDS